MAVTIKQCIINMENLFKQTVKKELKNKCITKISFQFANKFKGIKLPIK